MNGDIISWCSHAGTGVLILLAILYFIPALRHAFRQSPPGVFSFAYAIITTYGLILGIRLISSTSLHQSLNAYLATIFMQGKTPPRIYMIGSATFFSLLFVLANLVRSYFNLHMIEDAGAQDSDTGNIRDYIKSLSGFFRYLEYFLRILMFVFIIVIEHQILALCGNLDPNTDQPVFTKNQNFMLEFNAMWYYVGSFYASLFIWDGFLLVFPKRFYLQHGVIKPILMRSIFLHSSGIVTAILMSLTISPPKRIASAAVPDWFALLALLATIVGVVFFCLSLARDWPSIRHGFLFHRKHDHANT